LPLFAKTGKSGPWVDFSKQPRLHDESTSEIRNYLGIRAGTTFEILRRDRSKGEWSGGPQEKNIVLYIDLDLKPADVEWFLRMRDTVWRNRFKQDEIYLVFLKIWKEKAEPPSSA
jgi:hypothetical protein